MVQMAERAESTDGTDITEGKRQRARVLVREVQAGEAW
jgi:hypothetical protein